MDLGVENRSKIGKNRGLEGSRAGLEASWAVLGVPRRFWYILDRLGGVLEAPWKGLGSLLDGLGPRQVANMAPSLPPKRSQNQAKLDPKSDQLFSASWNRFWKLLSLNLLMEFKVTPTSQFDYICCRVKSVWSVDQLSVGWASQLYRTLQAAQGFVMG